MTAMLSAGSLPRCGMIQLFSSDIYDFQGNLIYLRPKELKLAQFLGQFNKGFRKLLEFTFGH